MSSPYELLVKQAENLIEGVPYVTANLANIAALLYGSLPDVSWAGFYLLEDGALILGPFQGKPACVKLPLGSGVCGTSAQEDRTLAVADVRRFPGHIACDSASRSEIVLPLHRAGRVVGVLDLDSPVGNRFSESDEAGLHELVRVLETRLFADAKTPGQTRPEA